MRHCGSGLRLVGALSLAAGVMVGAGACADEKVLAVRGGLQNMPGAQGGVKVDGDTTGGGSQKNYDAMLARYRPNDDGLVPQERHPLRLVDPAHPERVTLILRSPQDLVIQLYETLSNKEYELLYEQVLSERLKRNYRELLKDPHEAVTFLRKNERDVRALLATMPAADQTPGLFLQPLGDNMFRIEAPGHGMLDLKFEALDMVLEEGQFRLLLIH